jgi:hypothetical protein
MTMKNPMPKLTIKRAATALLLAVMNCALFASISNKAQAQSKFPLDKSSQTAVSEDLQLLKYAFNLTAATASSVENDFSEIKGFEAGFKETTITLSRRQTVNSVIVNDDEYGVFQPVRMLAAQIAGGHSFQSMHARQIFCNDTVNFHEGNGAHPEPVATGGKMNEGETLMMPAVSGNNIACKRP